MARGQWDHWLANHQRISKFHWPTQSCYMTSQWTKPLECQYIFSNGSTTVLLTQLTALPSTSVNCQLFNDGMYKAQARSGHFAKKRALAGCGELISSHGAHFLGGLTTVVDSGRAVNRLSERWMLKATSCGRNCPIPKFDNSSQYDIHIFIHEIGKHINDYHNVIKCVP